MICSQDHTWSCYYSDFALGSSDLTPVSGVSSDLVDNRHWVENSVEILDIFFLISSWKGESTKVGHTKQVLLGWAEAQCHDLWHQIYFSLAFIPSMEVLGASTKVRGI